MEKNEIRKKVIEIITKKLFLEKEPEDTDDIKETLGADSLDAVEIILSIEDAFGITIEDEDAEKNTIVGSVVDYIEKALSSS